MDRLEAMSIFVAAVEAGSFSSASRRLDVPLPTVSRKVSELEKHLNARLLVRSTRKLSLTEAGMSYLAACKRILEEVGNAERTAGGEYSAPRGELVMTAPIVFGRLHVLPVVCDFLAQFPEIRVRLVLSDRNIALIDDQIDVALRIGELPDSALVATRVGAVSYVVGASPAFLAAKGTPKTPRDLERMPCVTFDAVAAASSWLFASAEGRGDSSIRVSVRLSVNTAEAAVDAGIAGVGLIRVLSYQAARAVEQGELKLVLRKFEREPLPVNLVHTRQGQLPLKVRSFLDFAAPQLRKAIKIRV
jgi:DNA-binding transcriptional LysR family regulator